MAVRAGGSAPVLSITAAHVAASSSGSRSVGISGTFNFDDLLQFQFPAGLVVYQGSHFVRYDLNGQIVEGSSVMVADGILDSEVPSLLNLGSAAAAPATTSELRVDRITVVLPATFNSGAASVVLYAAFDGGSYVSNSVGVSLP
ncbi:MAG: hypothetical protein HY270_10825 [Deltaproteobacteria bacterium]|nr:hypothetical protein [Deltaproteobacteria bacterium]